MGLDLQRTWDVATLAVLPDYGSWPPRAWCDGPLSNGDVPLWRPAPLVAIFDMPAYRLLRWKLGMVFAGYTGIGPRPMGSSASSLPGAICETDVRMAGATGHACPPVRGSA